RGVLVQRAASTRRDRRAERGERVLRGQESLGAGHLLRWRLGLANACDRHARCPSTAHAASFCGYDGSAEPMKKFPDFVPPTKVSYLDRGPTLHLRRCILQAVDDPTQEWVFDKEEVRIGSMEDNDVVLNDDT